MQSFTRKPSSPGPLALLLPGLLGLFSVQVRADHLGVPDVVVGASRVYDSVTRQVDAGDTAQLLSAHPAVDLYQTGGLANLPVLRGLGDDRVKILLDGATVTSACGNHMNPPLSYMAPAAVGSISVLAGITPVSMGGDSIAGTIAVDSPAVEFSADPAQWLLQGGAASFYRSNNNGLSANVRASAASQNFSIGFSGGVDRAQSYEDGHGDKVRSTQFDRRYQQAVIGLKGEDRQFTLRLGHQDTLYQGFPNQRMDMTGNQSDAVNAHYQQQFGWGNLDARLFWQQVDHAMGFFSSEKTGTMPMLTEGKDYGFVLKLDVPLSASQLLRIGTDYHRQTLEDYWPPVPGNMMMGPQTFVNINDGKRDRVGLFGEVASQWSADWSSVLGLRLDYVRTDAGDVQSYNPNPVGMMQTMMFAADNNAARAFNARDKSKDDLHVDFSATAQYEASKTQSLEFGLARKTRSPNLYERYAWGRGEMAMAMVGWFGDVNGYVGDINLKPEKATTASVTLDWHDAGRHDWQLRVTPYYTYVQDYIGADRIGTMMMIPGGRPLLQFVNHDAALYGAEARWQAALWDDGRFGRGKLTGHLRYTRGRRLGNDEDLYQIMPLNARFAVEQSKGAWRNAVEVELVRRKTRVDGTRAEPETSGYGLVHLRSGYQWQHVRLDVAVVNLFDRYYELPLGGVDYSDWKAAGASGPIGALPGMGRSVNVGLTLDF